MQPTAIECQNALVTKIALFLNYLSKEDYQRLDMSAARRLPQGSNPMAEPYRTVRPGADILKGVLPILSFDPSPLQFRGQHLLHNLFVG